MTARGRANSTADWDPMADDYNNSSFDAQYADNDARGRVTLDHTKLYITNLPRGLSEEGLRTAFEKYGQVEACFISNNPQKKFALISFETAAEARIAMMKLNKTGPLNLVINIAHKKPNRNATDQRKDDASQRTSKNQLHNRSNREHSGSVTSRRSRNLEEPAAEESLEYQLTEDMGIDIDRELHIELESIKLEKLKLKEEQLMCKQKMLLLQQNEKRLISNPNTASGSSRRILPDGRIIIQSVPDKSQETDTSYTAGAGDSSTIPGLQSVRYRGCVACGSPADLYCSRCGITPYCSVLCQRKDWMKRHSAVCHNLMRLNKAGTKNATAEAPKEAARTEIDFEQTPRLRQPHSPKHNNQVNAARDSDAGKGRVDKPMNRANRAGPRAGTKQNVQQENGRNDTGSDDNWTTEKSAPVPKQQVNENKTSPRHAVKPQTEKVEVAKPKIAPAPEVKPVTVPEVKLVPDKYLVECLPIGESFVLSVEGKVEGAGGCVCVSLHADYGDVYNALVDDFACVCAATTGDVYSPAIGETFAYFNPSDEGWYRARRIAPNNAILIDAGKTVVLSESDRCCPLPPAYRTHVEFCCVIDHAEIGAQLKCVLLSKLPSGFKVSVLSADDDSPLGNAVITRWQPAIEWPEDDVQKPVEVKPTKPTANQTTVKQPTVNQPTAKEPTAKQPAPTNQTGKKVPEVPRPALIHNAKYIVCDVTSLKRACVRPCSDLEKFDSILQDVVLHGATEAVKLSEPPIQGQLVLGKYDDALFRAMVLRTKAAENRYMIEYIEYGNIEVVPIENLYVCPSAFDLTNRPTLASLVQLSTKEPAELTDPAKTYLETVKEVEEVIVTIPGGTPTVPSGALVQLSLAKNNDNINKKLEELCTPDWKKLEEKGGDVTESESLMFQNMRHIGLPVDRSFIMDVSDYSQLLFGSISGFEQGAPLRDLVYGPLTDKINAYAKSELCSEPYLPKPEELCIAKIPPFRQWFRAVMMKQVSGPGGDQAQVLYVDYGNVATTPVTNLRKMMPEFMKEPALGNHCEIKGWPKSVTAAQLKRAEEYLEVDDEGHGRLPVRSAYKDEDSIYILDAPELIAAITDV